MNHRSVFPLRMPQNVRQKIRDCALVENRTQTDLILEAIQQYMSKRTNRTPESNSGVASSFANNLKLVK